MSFFKDMLTGIDGESYDILRVLALASVVNAMALQTYVVVWKGQPFDMQSFGVGLGVVFASVGAALSLKAKTEPDPK